MPALAVLATLVLWGFVYRAVVAHPLDAMALTLYYLALQLIWRPLVLVTGLDDPFPTELFLDRDVDGLVVTAQAVVGVWLLALLAGARLLTPLVRPVSWLFPRSRHALPAGRLLLVALVVSLVALAVTAWLWSRYGGPTGLIEASKVDRDVAESRGLRSLPLVAALLSVAAFFAPAGRARGQRALALILVAVDGYLSFTWGARDVPVLSVEALLGGSLVFGGAGREVDGSGVLAWFRSPQRRRRLVLVAVVTLAFAFGLRSVRDTVLWGGPAPTISGETPVRQFAVATNNTFYDTLLLVLDDWPDAYDLRGSQDFVSALVTAVPSAIAGEQEPFVSPAVQVARTYTDRNNGFPATPLGDWWLALGLLGVVVGGMLAGLLARSAQWAFRRFTRDPLAWGLSLVFMLRVFPGGLWVTSIPKWVAIGVPLLALVAVLDRLGAGTGSRPGTSGPPPLSGTPLEAQPARSA